MYLFRLAYYSRNTIKALDKPVAQEMKVIMQQSAANNPAAGITGSLVFNDHFFAQVLEGDRKAVTATFCRIANDPRHSEIVILDANPISERMFDGWAMAYAGHSPEQDRIYLKHCTTIGFSPSKMTGEAFLGLVYDMVQSSGRISMTPLVEENAA